MVISLFLARFPRARLSPLDRLDCRGLAEWSSPAAFARSWLDCSWRNVHACSVATIYSSAGIASGDTAKFNPLLKTAASYLVVLYFEMFTTHFFNHSPERSRSLSVGSRRFFSINASNFLCWCHETCLYSRSRAFSASAMTCVFTSGHRLSKWEVPDATRLLRLSTFWLTVCMRSFTRLFSAFAMILLAFSVRIGQLSFRLGGVIDSSRQRSAKTKWFR